MKKPLFSFFYLLIFFSYLLFSLPASAAIVPNCSGATCTYCDLLQLLQNVISFMVYLSFPIAAAVFVYGGFVIMTARDSAEKAKEGRKILTSAVIGILIVLLAWLIIDTMIKIVAPNFNIASFGPWNQLQCSGK